MTPFDFRVLLSKERADSVAKTVPCHLGDLEPPRGEDGQILRYDLGFAAMGKSNINHKIVGGPLISS